METKERASFSLFRPYLQSNKSSQITGFGSPVCSVLNDFGMKSFKLKIYHYTGTEAAVVESNSVT